MKILFAGDFCPIGRTENFLKTERYSELFNGYENLLKDVDYSVVNLECPITKSESKILKTGPCLKTENENSLKALKFVGFNLLALANNHIKDYGNEGVMDTLKSAKINEFDIIGAGRDIFEASTSLIKVICGIKIGFVNISENEFCAASIQSAGAHTFDFIENTKSISALREKVDKVILIYHGGREHYQLPTPDQRKRLRYFIDIGVDAIVAHHTHCFSGYEYYNNKPIVYSLGNFLFDYKRKYQVGKWTEGISAVLSLKDSSNNFEVEIIPHRQGRVEDSTVRILEGNEKKLILTQIDALNLIIQDDTLFYEQWNSYLKTQERDYLSFLFIKNFFLRALFIKGLLPYKLLRSRNNKLLYNLLRCETHHEISKQILNNSTKRANKD